jgi:LAO/AO transport system kinase
MQQPPDIDELVERLLGGERTALARAITLVESERPADRAGARRLLERCMALQRPSLRLGITGIPGVGKSTLIDALGMACIKAGHRVAVLAVDPSSSRSGGSILGDKTRMERLSREADAFIRPSPTSGNLGGVARRTRESIVVCEAAGFDRVVIETVGVGQSELDVDRMTDLNVLLMIAGAGDELQGIKRGIMEAADLIAFTKADGEAAVRAERAARELRNAVGLLPPRDSGRHPEVLITSALTAAGIEGLRQRIEELHTQDLEAGRTQRRRGEQALHWMHRAVEEGLLQRFRERPAVSSAWEQLEKAVREGRTSPFQAAEDLLDHYERPGERQPPGSE